MCASSGGDKDCSCFWLEDYLNLADGTGHDFRYLSNQSLIHNERCRSKVGLWIKLFDISKHLYMCGARSMSICDVQKGPKYATKLVIAVEGV